MFTHTGFSSRGIGKKLAAGAMAGILLLASCGDSDSDSADAGDDSGETGAAPSEQTLALRGSGSDSRVSAEGEGADEDGGLSQDAIEDALSGDDEAMEEAEDDSGYVAATPAPVTVAPQAQEPSRIDRPSRTRTPEPDDTNFVDAGVNPFIDTRDDPQSTFALDVDTASYTVGRSWINQGVVPDPASVRVEEWVNYFDQDYAPPRNDTFAIYADGVEHPFIDDRTQLLRIGIAARDVSERRRDPVNLTFVVDTSGSMTQDDRMGLVREAMSLLVDQLDEDDTVAIVAYEDRARVVMEPRAGDEHNRIIDAINTLRPGGSTNAEAGLTLGYDIADEMWRRGDTNRVVLLSDGVANVGATGPETILERIGDRARDDIHLITIGVGFGNFNDNLLEQLANQGDGWYAYVDTVDEAERIFVDDLVGSLQVVAEDAKVQVEFDSRNVDAYRLIGFENRDVADEDFRNDNIDAGEIGAGHTVTALYEVELARGVDPGDGQTIATVNLRWTEPDARRADEVNGTITTDVLDTRQSDASAHYMLTATAATFAEVLRESRYVRGVDLDDLADAAEDAAREIDTDQAWELVELIEDAIRLL